MLPILPALFSSYAVAASNAASGDWRDADLPEGTHFRVVPHSAVGLPTTSLLLWPAPVRSVHDALTTMWGGSIIGSRVTPSNAAAPVRLQLRALQRDLVPVGVEAVSAGDAVHRIALVHPATGRIAAARSSAPWRVGGPLVHTVDVWASGPFDIVLYAVSQENLQLPEPGQGVLLGMPELDGRWYRSRPVHPYELEGSLQRVLRCSSLVPSIVQVPGGPFTPFGIAAQEQEVQRVREIEPHLQEILQQVVNAERREDRVQAMGPTDRPLDQAEYVPMRSLLLQAVDPGVARYLGLMTMVTTTQVPIERPHAWACAGLFALDTSELPKGPLVDRLEEHAGRANAFARRFERADTIGAAASASGLMARVMATAALVVPPPERPPAPVVTRSWVRWIRVKDGPSTEFQQGMEVANAPMAPLVALARRNGAGWEPRNGLAVEGGRWQRTMLLGARRPQDGQGPSTDPAVGLLQDMRVPAAGAPWTYQTALGDIFGRFGAAAVVTVPIPDRPRLPEPSVRAFPVYAAVLADGTAPASPGDAVIEILLNGSQRQPAGAFPLRELKVKVENAGEGGEHRFALDAAGEVPFHEQLVLKLRPTAPTPESMRGYTVTVTVTVLDTGGQVLSKTETFSVADPRPPALPMTAAGLIWSGRPGPAVDVELALTMRAPPDSRWRAYLTDANTLLGEHVAGTRAEIADAGALLSSAAAESRDSFRLITPEPIVARDGTLTLISTLPRALEAVQFVRLVPITEQGVEGAFAKSPLIPVAVPLDRRPPAPTLSFTQDGSGNVMIKVLAHGLKALLKEAEPGLFETPPAAASRAPQLRLRRTGHALADPLYAREVPLKVGDHGEPRTLSWDSATQCFEATFVDTEVVMYGRYFYWAEVRLPPERRVKIGAQEHELTSEHVRGLDPSQMQDAPGLYSEPSAALMVCPVPATVPGLTSANLVCTFDGNGSGWMLNVMVSNGPVVPRLSVGEFSVRGYVKTTTDPEWKAFPASVPLDRGAAVLTFVDDANAIPEAVLVSVELIDPLGRISGLLTVSAERVT